MVVLEIVLKRGLLSGHMFLNIKKTKRLGLETMGLCCMNHSLCLWMLVYLITKVLKGTEELVYDSDKFFFLLWNLSKKDWCSGASRVTIFLMGMKCW